MRAKILPCVFALWAGFSTGHAQRLSIDSLKLLVAESKEDTNTVIHCRMLAGLLRLTDPVEGIRYGKAGVALGRKLDFDKGVAGCFLNLSVCYNSRGMLDSSLHHIDTAIYYSHLVGDPNRLALAYLNRADAYMQMQNFDQSLKDCDTSMIYAELANSDDRRARVLQTIGSVYFFQELYDRSTEYYQRANTLYLKNNNLQMSAIVLNNLALVNKNSGQYLEAVEFLRQALGIADSLNDLSNMSMYHGGLSDVFYHLGDFAKAEEHANIAMGYAKQLSNEMNLGSAWQYLGQVYLKQGKTAEGIRALAHGYEIFDRRGDLEKVHTAAGLLAQAYASTGNYQQAYRFQEIENQAHDTLVRQRYDDDIAMMQTRFRVDEKDKEIDLLNKERELQEQRLARQRLMVAGSIVLLIVTLAGIGLFISQYRLKNRMKELELRNRIAADLHDEVGSSLSSIHMLSQIANQHDSANRRQKEILSRMSDNARETMEKMSDIVWMIKPGETEGSSLRQRIERFAYEVGDNKNIEINTDVEALDRGKFSMDQRKNIYLVFKEALNNAAKYSGTSKIDIHATTGDHQFSLIIKDYGSGFDVSQNSTGNGLGNMKARAKELNGTLNIRSTPGEGTSVELFSPL